MPILNQTNNPHAGTQPAVEHRIALKLESQLKRRKKHSQRNANLNGTNNPHARYQLPVVHLVALELECQ